MDTETPTDFGAKWQLCDDIKEGDIILFDEPVWKKIRGRGKNRYEVAGTIRIIAQAKNTEGDFLKIAILHAISITIEAGRRTEIGEKLRYIRSNPDTKRKLSKLAKNNVYRTNWSDEIARAIVIREGEILS